MQYDILEPLAVVPLQDSFPTEAASLVDFAKESNSQVVVASDDLGNQITVGIFVTESFDAKQLPDVANANPNWVGAVEECSSQVEKNVSLDAEISGDKQPTIRVYKVNKGPKGKKHVDNKRSSIPKTLVNLKRNKIVHNKRGVKQGIVKEENIITHDRKEKHRKCGKKRPKTSDKSYNRPSKSKFANLEGNKLCRNIGCFCLFLNLCIKCVAKEPWK